MEQREKYNFDKFKRSVQNNKKYFIPLNERAYDRYYNRSNSVNESFDYETIKEILRGGEPESLRKLSKYYYRVSGIYRNAILMLANLPLYDWVITPFYDINKKVAKNLLLKKFYEACDFAEKLNIPITFSEISNFVLMNGMYYGILREEKSKYVIQELPFKYCRTRFKDYNGLDIPEFNVSFFRTIKDDEERNICLMTYPPIVRKKWNQISLNTSLDSWVPIYPDEGGMCFYLTHDQTPLLVSSIPQINKMEEAIEREAMRDQNELYKLLIQKMPIDNKGELVFQLDEVADIHESVAQMLNEIDTVNVLTTFGDVSLESVQDSSAATQANDKIKKYQNSTYSNLGLSQQYFNPETANGMSYAIAKDESIMNYLTNLYSNWIKVQINNRFNKNNLAFDFIILPTTRHNRKEIQSQYFQGAQYGYSKMYAGVAIGIKQKNMISLMDFENEILEMDDKMIPLMSSYTSSGKDLQNLKNKNENSNNDSIKENITNEGGRPALDATEQSDKTAANNAAK